MARTSRALAGIAFLAVVLAVAATVLLRAALLRGPVRDAAEARLSEAFGQKVTIGAVGVTLLPRPALTGSDVRVGAENVEAPAVRVARVRIVPRLWSIVRGPLDIEEVRLEGFAASVLRTRDGRWHVPAVVPVAAADARPGASIGRVLIADGQLRVLRETAGHARDSASIDGIEAQLVPGPDGARLSPIRGRVGQAGITGEARATTTSLDLTFDAPSIGSADLTPLLALLGSERPDVLQLDARAALSAAVRIARATARMTGTGVVKAPAVMLDSLRLQRVEAPFRIDGSRLTFDPTTFTLYGGSHRGPVTFTLDATPPRWSAVSHVQHFDLGAFLDALAGRDAKIDGTANVEAAVGGPVGANLAETVVGRARLDVSDGVVHDFPLVAAINRALRLTAGTARDTRFTRLSATLAVGHGGATTDDLLLEAGEVRVAAAGRIGFDRSLDLRGTATLSEARTTQAIASIHELARLRRNGTIDLPLTITGTLDTPEFGIDLKTAIEQGIADELLRRLRGLIKR